MTLILEDTEQLEFQLDLIEIIEPIENLVKSLFWVVSDLEYMVLSESDSLLIPEFRSDEQYIKLKGTRLVEILKENRNQFVWGVFCGSFHDPDELCTVRIPVADGNERIWTKPDEFFFSDTEIEIICFDSSATIIRFRSQEIEKLWLDRFPDTKQLVNQ